MTRLDDEQYVKDFFTDARTRYKSMVRHFVEDDAAADSVVDQAATVFEGMIPTMAYVEKRDHPMASSVFICCATLAVYLVLKDRGVDVHAYGSTMLSSMAQAPAPSEQASEENADTGGFATFFKYAEESQTEAAPGEFVYEAFFGDRKDFDWGMNVKSCAICHAFSKYDAMDLVPYMCATDDVMSDLGGQGLRRNGTIALGAHECDFRYQSGGDAQRLAQLYPDRIRVVENS